MSEPEQLKNNYSENDHVFHKRGERKALERIQTAYGIPKKRLELPPILAEKLEAAFTQELNEDKWRDLKKTLHPALQDEEKTSIDTIAHNIMMKYATSFYIRSVVKDDVRCNHDPKADASQKFYRKNRNAVSVLETLVSHITNQSQASLEEITQGNPQIAYDMHKYLLGRTMTYCKQYGIESRHTAVSPYCREIIKAENCVPTMKQYANDQSEALRDAFFTEFPDRKIRNAELGQTIKPSLQSPSNGTTLS